jgi:Fe-S oxidoreductase
MERITGIDRRRRLPRYAGTTLASWFRRRRGAGASPAQGKVALFATCSVNYNDVEAGKAAAFVLGKNGIDVVMPPQECCGMPKLDGGLVHAAAAQARRNVERLWPLVRDGYTVVVPGPTCAFMMKNEWPELLRTDEARRVAAATRDLSEYLIGLKAAGKLSTDFPVKLGTVAYHVPCHLKAQNIGLPSKELLALAGARIEVIDRCSGVDGTWGLKHAYYDMSVKVADKLMTRVNDAEKAWDAVVSDCPLSGLTIAERSRYTPEHPIVALARAYGYRPGEAA